MAIDRALPGYFINILYPYLNIADYLPGCYILMPYSTENLIDTHELRWYPPVGNYMYNYLTDKNM